MDFQKICILGLGYIGLPTAATLAAKGQKVIGVDINPRVLEALNDGRLHIHEPGLLDVVSQGLQTGNLIVRQEPEAADAFIIAVPTPFYTDKSADLSYVVSAAESIFPVLRKGNLVVLESTSPPQTTVNVVLPILERSGLKAGEDFMLAYSPERVLPGQILRELTENARVIGGIDHTSAKAGRDLYKIFVRGEIILTDSTTAEMVKIMENTFRDVNIALANEFSRLADRFGIDIWEAVSIANRHPRVKILNPGPGVGGHCISVDPWFLVEAAPDLTNLIRTARQVNDSQPAFVVELVKRALGKDLKGKYVAVLGLTYKPDVDDMRESPAVELAHLLSKEGCIVRPYEPFKLGESLEGFETTKTLEDAVGDVELIVLAVGHQSLRQVTPQMLEKITPARKVVDAINGWSSDRWQKSVFEIYRLGVGR